MSNQLFRDIHARAVIDARAAASQPTTTRNLVSIGAHVSHSASDTVLVSEGDIGSAARHDCETDGWCQYVHPEDLSPEAWLAISAEPTPFDELYLSTWSDMAACSECGAYGRRGMRHHDCSGQDNPFLDGWFVE